MRQYPSNLRQWLQNHIRKSWNPKTEVCLVAGLLTMPARYRLLMPLPIKQFLTAFLLR